jgi:predicted RNase H-like HicB family nuclease
MMSVMAAMGLFPAEFPALLQDGRAPCHARSAPSDGTVGVRLDEPGPFHYMLDISEYVGHIRVERMSGAGPLSSYQVTVEWDEEARVWVASCEEVPGLATGADTLEDLIAKLRIVIPELLVENGILPAGTDSVPFTVKAERRELAPVG